MTPEDLDRLIEDYGGMRTAEEYREKMSAEIDERLRSARPRPTDLEVVARAALIGMIVLTFLVGLMVGMVL